MPGRHITSCLLFAVALALLAVGCGGGEGDQATITESSRETSRGGEASIEDFGEEAVGSERTATVDAFERYLGALAEEDFATVCSYLTSSVHRSLKQFVSPKLRAEGCPMILPKLLAATAKIVAREQLEGEVTKVRIEGDRGFVIFRAPGAKLYQMPMERESDKWKSALVAASVLVPEL